jgi:hypothetical protein
MQRSLRHMPQGWTNEAIHLKSNHRLRFRPFPVRRGGRKGELEED